MKTKHWIGAIALVLTMTQFGCGSKEERKADKVQDEYKDVIEAQREGDTSEVREEQADLDSARKDYREMAKDSAR